MIWHFNEGQLEMALEAWKHEIQEPENPEAARLQVEIVREFLESYKAKEYGLSQETYHRVLS